MKYYKIIIAAFIFFSVSACDEDILLETPLDFLSPENSFTKPEDIEATLFSQYRRLLRFNDGNWQNTAYLHVGTDLGMACRNPADSHFGNYPANLLPTTGIVSSYWSQLYDIVFTSNVVLNRIENVVYSSQAEKDAHIAEALFFRGYAYRCLVHLYGGVPLVLEEITSPRRDFVRSTKEETLNQAILDLKFAAENLPSVAEVDAPGRVSNAAALHTLSELYITIKEWDLAIDAATSVIDDPNIALMTTRFGNRAGDEGDPYWDLFQRFNQNRSSGNTEGILVLQSEFDVPGGSAVANNTEGFLYERCYGPLYWFVNDPDGVKIFFGASTQNGGRPVGFIRPTPYFTHTIWEKGGNWDVDVRNNNRNIQRYWVTDNPSSAYFGIKTSDYPQSWFDGLSAQDTLRDFHPYITKVTTKNDHPTAAMSNPSTGLMASNSGKTHADWYLMRVAETYLLRAEAYLGKGQEDKAAADINMLRNRANAIPVDPADVDIDYILDERMRELNWEEQRRMTLSRLDKLYDRTVLGNPFSGNTVQPHNNLFPIPFSEIERNTQEVLEQNPNYN
ncbi:RagB/SusD family nutrient uptake outer membrane protein [Aestuariivivens sp. NBU2969]|uniref:RagB/SusD family nutrient uptake outer membrane protein n=1 Tax=Aestuariivivens sp. NBU2969 TaxID=2873267 RepID=UPI001CBA8622|nr:RagB/SusD family nutrient uptake outer membrane protein [Aestuariivivens sp. NBU2969]